LQGKKRSLVVHLDEAYPGLVTREEAQRERDRKAQEDPDSTWLIAEKEPGIWSVVKVGLKPTDSATGEAREERPKPSYADDPRSAQSQNFSNWGVG
jgi:hypothetical protein